MTKKPTAHPDLDSILIEIGEFGKYQIIHYIYISIPIFLLAGFTLSYVFTAGNLDYRCHVPECEENNQTIYDPPWLPNAVPQKNGRPIKCHRFVYQQNDSEQTNECTADHFNQSIQTKCNHLIYKTDEITIVNEFNITCEENEWKLAMIGSINNIAQFIFMPIGGFISDRYGRRTLFLIGVLCSTFFGLLRSFSTNYYMFAAAEFFDAGMASGTYSSAFILGLEMVGPSKRVLGSILLSCSYSIGEAMLAILAMYTRNFRTLLRWIYTPAILITSYFWIIPESVRWLMITGKNDQANKIIISAAKMNNVILSEETLMKFRSYDSLLPNGVESKKEAEEDVEDEKHNQSPKRNYPIFDVLKSRILLIRMLICSYCWLTNTLVYYGLGLNSVALAGNKYINFVFVSLAEIPGYAITYFIMERFGRRHCLCGSLLICGIVCVASEFLPADATILKLSVFLLGKCMITISFTVLYIYTAELYPTNLRHSLLSWCSTVGRIGSMIAPQTPLLTNYMQSLPLLIFGGTAITSGLLILNFPETLNVKLPDTIEEAEHINKKLPRKLGSTALEPLEKAVF